MPAEGLYKEKGSRFISWIFPVGNEEDVREILARLRKEYHGARHYCFAWRLGREKIRFRANDDGEPSSSAGKPILGQLIQSELTQVLLVVIRYFGGTLLGVSGLINAYREAAADAIRNAVIENRIIEVPFRLEFPFESMNPVMQILKTENIRQRSLQHDYGCRIEIGVRKAEAQRMLTLFGSLPGVSIVPLEPE